MDNVSTKCDKVQIRISREDKELIRKIKARDSDFNVSLFFRKALREYGNRVAFGVGTFKIG